MKRNMSQTIPRPSVLARLALFTLAAAFFVTASIPAPSMSAGIEVPADSLAKLLLKIISMENGLITRAGDSKVAIGVVGSEASSSFTAPLISELQKNHEAKLLDKDYEIKTYNPEEIEKAYSECHVIFVAETGAMKPSDIAAAGEGKAVIVFAREPSWVDEGLMVGVFLEDQKPKIVLNLAAARKAGLEFKNQLLKISRVLK